MPSILVYNHKIKMHLVLQYNSEKMFNDNQNVVQKMFNSYPSYHDHETDVSG